MEAGLAGLESMCSLSLLVLVSLVLVCLPALDLDLSVGFFWWYFYLQMDALLPKAYRYHLASNTFSLLLSGSSNATEPRR